MSELPEDVSNVEVVMTTVYKVVRRRRDGNLASAFIKRGRCLVIYKPNEPSFALDGMKLLAFSEKLPSAAAGGFFGPGYQVWEAEATNVHPQAFLEFLFMTWDSFRRFWTGQGEGQRGVIRTHPGTVACDSITLIKRVDGHDA